jgi:hypothetical protein
MSFKNIEEFNEKKYTVVNNVVNLDFLKIVSQYGLFDEIQDFFYDDVQVIGAHTKYADPLMESMLMHFKDTIEDNTGLYLDPTYSCYRVYRNGDVLKPHVDRESCEISCTVSFGSGHDMAKYCWPIFMDGNEVLLYPGDLAIYKGLEVNHWRDSFAPPTDSWQVQGFFHYVDKNGPYKEWKEDKRPGLGYSWEHSEEHNKEIVQKKNKSYITFTNN